MKRKFWTLPSLIAILYFFPLVGWAQKTSVDLDEKDSYKVRPIRIGVKIGFPNLVGGNLEYVTPLMNKKLAVTVDYSKIKSDWLLESEDMGEGNNDQINFGYMDIGLNYYFFKSGKGLYAGAGYNTIKAEGTMENDDSVDYIDEKHSSVNIKLGAKLGGLFYFRPEVGYSFDPLPKKYDVLTVYDDGTRENRTDDWSDAEGPADILFKGLMANIGIGFAF